ncbi:MAG TPA: HAMP domain-containing sensor histidine kinase [Chthoniobacteraceae bacterium]|jgi:two-component system sensor histidine kinase HupT/HoxJ
MATAPEKDQSLEPLEAFALERSARPALAEITLGLLHRFNNSATGLGFLAERGAAALAESHPARKDFEDIIKTLGKAQRFLDLIAEVQLGEVREPAYVALDTLLERQTEIFRAALAKGTALHVQAPTNVVVRLSETHFRQALLHLVQNAREAMEGIRKSALRITATVEGSWGAIRLHDNGPGIDEAALAQLFQPFATTKSPEKHAGVGTHLAHRIAEKCGWELSGRNHPEGGAEFTLRLPVETE